MCEFFVKKHVDVLIKSFKKIMRTVLKISGHSLRFLHTVEWLRKSIVLLF